MSYFVDQIIHRIEVEYDGSDNPVYVGLACPGTATSAAKWRILKIEYTGTNPVRVIWAKGVLDFAFVWDDRTTYTYS